MELLLGILLLSSCFNQIQAKNHQHYNAIFSFGDSFADTGNFDILAAPMLSYISYEHLPYGMSFFGTPSGRATNGRVILDFIAAALGFPNFVPPALSKDQNFKRGANFAVIGACALDLSFYEKNNVPIVPPINSSLSVQLEWFHNLKLSLCGTSKKCKKFFKKSLFFIGEFGANDYYFLSITRKTVEEVKSNYVPKIVNAIITAAESLIKQGAVHMVLPGSLVTGCTPAILAINPSANKTDYDPQTGCMTKFNSVGNYHN
ncbi:hypothetical protein LUZ60_009740 [Juncus effusus]|nr:hypothetical protein LUZ60_009740 [Juncus effusus]